MSTKRVVIIGAGPCGLAALKEMREAGHDAVAIDKGRGLGGVFSSAEDNAYENLYLTISNMMMAFSDFPPEDLRLKYSPAGEYAATKMSEPPRALLRPGPRSIEPWKRPVT